MDNMLDELDNLSHKQIKIAVLFAIVNFIITEIIAIATAITYGIINDCVTSMICPQYFTRGFHRKMSENWSSSWYRNWAQDETSTTKIALVWGVLATWEMGAGLGVLLGGAVVVKGVNPLRLIRPAILAIAFMSVYTFWAGVCAYKNIKRNGLSYYTNSAAYTVFEAPYAVDEDQLERFEVVMKAHGAAYSSGGIAALLMCAYVLIFLPRMSLFSY